MWQKGLCRYTVSRVSHQLTFEFNKKRCDLSGLNVITGAFLKQTVFFLAGLRKEVSEISNIRGIGFKGCSLSYF